MTRRKQGQAKDAGADEVAVGDLRDPASVRAALDGVDGVFLIIPAFAPDTALGTGIVAAAQAAGVGGSSSPASTTRRCRW